MEVHRHISLDKFNTFYYVTKTYSSFRIELMHINTRNKIVSISYTIDTKDNNDLEHKFHMLSTPIKEIDSTSRWCIIKRKISRIKRKLLCQN